MWQRDPAAFEDEEMLRSADAVVVVGGDGTLRAVVDRSIGLLGEADLPPLLVVGLGTANLMQRHLGLRYAKAGVGARVAALLTAGRTRAVDLGRVGDRVFLLVTGVGYDAGVVHALAKARRGPITKLSYVGPALRNLRDLTYTDVTVRVDGRTVHAAGPAQVFVGNVPEYGTGFPVLTDADSADGLLDVCVLPCANHLAFARLLWRLARGGHRETPGVTYVRGRDVEIDAADPVPVQIDGDPAGTTPVRLGLLPRRANFIVP